MFKILVRPSKILKEHKPAEQRHPNERFLPKPEFLLLEEFPRAGRRQLAEKVVPDPAAAPGAVRRGRRGEHGEPDNDELELLEKSQCGHAGGAEERGLQHVRIWAADAVERAEHHAESARGPQLEDGRKWVYGPGYDG